ncbi:MAG: hypothetical protein RBR22_13290 [Desulfuromonas sp.]|nr:hypothetical protein [Desulfuromonas sp.]
MHTVKQISVKLLALLSISLFALAPQALAQSAHNTQNSSEIHKLAIAPLISVSSGAKQAQALSETLDCALSGLCYLRQETLTPAERSLTSLLRQGVAEYYGEALIPQPEVTTQFLTMPKTDKDTPRDIAIRLGEQLGVDHVLIGILWRFDQRVGSPLSADRPASVAFNLFLLDVVNNRLVWQGSFDKTQKALSDNLFEATLFFKSGVKWLSAEELAEFGIKKTLQSLK